MPQDHIFTGNYLRLLVVQFSFGFAFSTFILLPKYLKLELGSSATQIGQVTGLALLSGVASVPLIGFSINRFSKRTLIIVGSLVMAIAAAGFLAVSEVGPLLYALRILQGSAFVLTVSAAATLVADISPPARLGEAIGFFGLSMLSTNALAPAIIEPLALAHGWPAAFSLAGLAAAIAAVAAIRLETPKRELSRATAALRVLTSQRSLTVLYASAIGGAAVGVMFTYVQPFAIERGARNLGGFFIAYTAAAVLVRLAGARLADQYGRRLVSMIALFFYAIVVVATAGLEPDWLIPIGAAFGLAHGLFFPSLNAMAIESVAPERRGIVTTLFMGAFNAGFALSALALGPIADHYGYPSVFVTTGAVTFSGVFALLRVPA